MSTMIKTEYGPFVADGDKSAEQVYAEYLKNKDKQIDNCSEPTDKERIVKLEIDKVALAENVYMLAEIIESLIGGTEDGQSNTTAETATD